VTRTLGKHVLLFALTCVTTFLSGAGIGDDFNAIQGLYFSGTLMTILLCHEMGHYVVSRRHGIAASLPYFIPLPPVISLGTLGAVISMDEPIDDRNKLVDVGAAGPLAGLVVAIPLMIYGLSLSSVAVTPPAEGVMMEGNSLLYLGLKYLVHGQILPSAEGLDVQLHPMAFAAWVGFLLTMINLLPIGQLDGGHVLCGAIGKRHERVSRMLHWLLLGVGVVVAGYFAVTYAAAGTAPSTAVLQGVKAGLPWLVWAAMLLVMRRMSGGTYHPPVGETPLTRSRQALVVFLLLVLVLLFTPVPLRAAVP